MSDLIYFGKTNIGKKRELNEDSILLDGKLNLFLVADGMGGHNAGEVASNKAIQIVQDFVNKGLNEKEYQWLKNIDTHYNEIENVIIASIKLANKYLFDMAKENTALKGMGTTIAGILFYGEEAYIFNVGDSRVYNYKNGNFLQITEDHSWVNEQLKLNLLTKEEARNHKWKNIITRALGTNKDIEVDIFKQKIESGELFLICSDGLTSMLDDSEIKNVIEMHRLSIEDMVRELIDEANANGGLDNISIIAVEII